MITSTGSANVASASTAWSIPRWLTCRTQTSSGSSRIDRAITSRRSSRSQGLHPSLRRTKARTSCTFVLMDPYRASTQAPPRQLALRPDAAPWVVIVTLVGLTLMSGVMADRGARVIRADCARKGESVSCAVSERTLFTSENHTLEARGLNHFDVQWRKQGKSTTEWIALDAQQGSGPLTGRGLPTAGREAALERLNAFAGDPAQLTVSATIGSVWGGLTNLGFLFPFAVVLWAMFGSRVTVTVRARRQVRVESRLWPLPARGIDFETDKFAGFDTDLSSKRNTRIVVLLADGTRFPLTRSYTSTNKAAAMQRMEAFIRDEPSGT